MQMDDMILVSIDDHIIEPPDLFKNHLSAEQLDEAPKFVSADGKDCWVFEGRRVLNIGLNAVVGRPREEYGCEPESLDQMREGTYNVDKRVEDMNANGILGSVCFGTFVAFDGSFFVEAKDKTNAIRVIQAYNDWHIDEWCGAHPGRFIPLAIVPLWDIDAILAEVRRVVTKGCRAIAFPDNPAAKGLPSIHSDYWEPLWQLCNDERVVLNCHIGTGYAPPHPSMESSINCWITSMPISISNAAADWMHMRALTRYPDLKIALSEGGIGWVPYLLERADFTFYHHGPWTRTEFGGKLPSELFREHFLTCFVDDKFGLANYEAIGEDLICFECDYPHSDSVWPEAPEVLWSSIQNLPPSVINKITHGNVMRDYGYNPFENLGRESCTVGALRKQAEHVDTSPVSRGGQNPTKKGAGPVTSGDVVKMFSDQLEGTTA